jgi:hypothetical protein
VDEEFVFGRYSRWWLRGSGSFRASREVLRDGAAGWPADRDLRRSLPGRPPTGLQVLARIDYLDVDRLRLARSELCTQARIDAAAQLVSGGDIHDGRCDHDGRRNRSRSEEDHSPAEAHRFAALRT